MGVYVYFGGGLLATGVCLGHTGVRERTSFVMKVC